MTPTAPGRFGIPVTVSQETHDKLRRAQALLGHAVPSGDLAQVLDRALDALIVQLEKRRFARCERPGVSRRSRVPENDRHIAAAIKRQVWERDGGRCTFVGTNGHRCEARSRLEFDHIEPVARGDPSTPSNLRLRCRAHNRFEAERTYGADFMEHKREQAKRRAAEAQTREAAQAAERERQARLQARRDELIPFLRHLGYSLAESRLASTVCDSLPDATLEQRLRAALQRRMPSGVRIERPCERGAA